MAKFHFRLQTLQKLREAHRDEMRSKLAEAIQAEKLLEEQVNAVYAEEAVLLNGQRSSLQQSQTNVNQLLDSQRYVAVLRSQITAMKGQAKVLAEEIEKRRLALVEADKQVRILEKLHERQLESHRNQVKREEIKFLDEIGARQQEIDFR